MKSILPVMALAALLTSCQNPLNTMEEMKETTKEMAKTTKQMNQKMDETNRNTADLQDVSKHGFSEEKRDQKWMDLIPYRDMGADLSDAKVLMLSFEYQIWTGVADKNGLFVREELIKDALDEFFRRMTPTFENLQDSGKLEEMSPLDLEGDKKQSERTFYAIATTMHFTDIIQREYVKRQRASGVKIQEISLYDIFKNALTKDANGESLSENEEKVLIGANRDMVVELLQARMNFLSALGIKLSVSQDDMSFKDKANGLWFKLTGGRSGALKVNSIFHEQNAVTREQALTYLDGALKAKKLLEEIGAAPKLQNEIESIFINLEIEDAAQAAFAQEIDNSSQEVTVYGKALKKRQKIESDLAKLIKLKDELAGSL